MPRIYDLTHSTTYHYSGLVAMCQNQLRLTPRTDSYQQLLNHRIDVQPKPSKILKTSDFFQNHLCYFELNQPHSMLQITMNAHVKVDRAKPYDLAGVAWEGIASSLALDYSREGLERFQYTLPSPMVPQCGDALALATKSFTPGRPILDATLELNRRIHQEFRYDPKATTIHTPLDDVFRIRRGVCQDLAHAMIACFRSIGLAARYVSGYLRTYPSQDRGALVGADASHAWVSVFSGPAGWVDFDPTNDLVVTEEHLTLAWGRDFRDVTPINGLFVGAEQQSLDVAVQVRPL